MKRLAAMLAVALVVSACHGKNQAPGSREHTELQRLSEKNGCAACHSLDTPGVGPSWRDVAWKYERQTSYEYAYKTYSVAEGLARKASLGGRHDWGEAIMLANDPDSIEQKGVRQDDIRKMVRFILKLPPGKRPATEPPPAH